MALRPRRSDSASCKVIGRKVESLEKDIVFIQKTLNQNKVKMCFMNEPIDSILEVGRRHEILKKKESYNKIPENNLSESYSIESSVIREFLREPLLG